MRKKIPRLTKAEARATDRLLKKKARILVDENIGKLAEILRELGWNAVSAQEAGIQGHPDEDIFAYAWRQKRLLITSDADFLDDWRFPFHRCAGVIVLPSPGKNFDAFAEALGSALPVIGRYYGAFDREKVLFRSDGTWSVRGFSKERGTHWATQFKTDARGQSWEKQEYGD